MPNIIQEFDLSMLKAAFAVAEKPLLLYIVDGYSATYSQVIDLFRALSEQSDRLNFAWMDGANSSPDLSKLGIAPPLMLLIRPSGPPALLSEPRTLTQVQRWLDSLGFSTEALSQAPDGCVAFYGDNQLRDFFYQRLSWHARAGHIEISNEPIWVDGRGTISAAMVHDADPIRFERLTGMPYAFACLLEFLDVSSQEEIDQLFHVLQPGAQLDGVAINLIGAWLGCDDLPWEALIDDRRINALRLAWLALDAKRRFGESVALDDWQALREEAGRLTSGDDPHKTLQRQFARLIAAASPPPGDHDYIAWRRFCFGVGNYAKLSMVRYLNGWRHHDFAMETLLFRWFSEREACEPGERFTPATLAHAQREWEAQPKDWGYIERERAFHEHGGKWLASFNQPWWRHLLALLLERSLVV